MRHILHMLVFAGLISVFFAFLQAPAGRRLNYGLWLWAIMAGAGLALGLLMSLAG